MGPGTKRDGQYWIAALRRGDDLALPYFFGLHYRSLYYFVQGLIHNPPEAEDIVSDCFLKLWERSRDFETETNVKAFLYISARNACLNHLKHITRKTAAQSVYLQQLDHDENVILNRIIAAEVIDMIAQEIESLPEKCKAVFKLIHFEGKKTDEIALELDLSVQTVRNHKTRALALLKISFLKKGLSNEIRFLLFIILGIQ